MMTGVTWNGNKKKWSRRRVNGVRSAIRQWDTGKTASDTKLFIQSYLTMMKESGSAAPDWDRDAVKMRIDALFDHIPPRHWTPLLASIQTFLEGLHADFAKGCKNRREVHQVFIASSYAVVPFTGPKPKGEIHGRRSYAFDIGAQVVTKYRKRMAEKYADLTKTLEPDGSRIVSFNASKPLTFC